MGLVMMVGYLLFDGLTSSWQERLFKKSNVRLAPPLSKAIPPPANLSDFNVNRSMLNAANRRPSP